LLTIAGTVTHLVPHAMGFSTVGATGMLAAACLPRRLCLFPVLLVVALSDVVHGTYALVGMAFVYAAHLGATIVLPAILARLGVFRICVAAVLNAVVFYLVSNIAPMVMGFYPATLDGWVTCYVNGLPFLARGIAANLVFGGLALTVVALVKHLRDERDGSVPNVLQQRAIARDFESRR